MAIPLLHFARRINPAGRGARLTQVAIERGIAWEVVRTWERRMKRWKHSPRLCPLCPLCRASRGQKGGECQE